MKELDPPLLASHGFALVGFRTIGAFLDDALSAVTREAPGPFRVGHRVLRFALRRDFCAALGNSEEIVGQSFKSIWRNAYHDGESVLPHC